MSQSGNLVGNSLVGTCLTLPNLGFLWVFFKYPKISKSGNPLFFPVNYLKNSIGKVEYRLLQKINCFNFGSINAQKNKDRSVYANNLRPHLPSESKLSSTDRNSKQYFYKYSKGMKA